MGGVGSLGEHRFKSWGRGGGSGASRDLSAGLGRGEGRGRDGCYGERSVNLQLSELEEELNSLELRGKNRGDMSPLVRELVRSHVKVTGG